jgi:hypothetical protein
MELMARFARQTECSGGQKGRGLGGMNFCPPSLSTAANKNFDCLNSFYLVV